MTLTRQTLAPAHPHRRRTASAHARRLRPPRPGHLPAPHCKWGEARQPWAAEASSQHCCRRLLACATITSLLMPACLPFTIAAAHVCMPRNSAVAGPRRPAVAAGPVAAPARRPAVAAGAAGTAGPRWPPVPAAALAAASTAPAAALAAATGRPWEPAAPPAGSAAAAVTCLFMHAHAHAQSTAGRQAGRQAALRSAAAHT